MSFVEPTKPPFGKLECGFRDYLSIYQDQNQDGIYSIDELGGVLVPFSISATAEANYGYRNYSAHPMVGPQGKVGAVSVFFTSGPDGLSFNFFLDKESGTSHDNRADIVLTVRNNQHLDQVRFSDEEGEFQAVDADPISTFYRGRFNYKLTTDGGIVGPLVGSGFEIEFETLEKGTLKEVQFSTARGPMVLAGPVRTGALSFLIRVSSIDPCALAAKP